MTRLTSRHAWLAAPTLALTLIVPAAAAERPWPSAQEQAAPTHAITWPAERAAVEQWLREAAVERSEDLPVGVTKPRRVFFRGDGPARSAAWKPLAPGIYKGYWESYKSEIAAYELDKMLGLDMVPPSVERTISGDRGAAILWVEGVKGWDQKNPLTPPDPVAWTREVVRMKMFDQLIGNIDRNAGNLLYDQDYHIILIDHSRAFTTTTDMRRMAAPGRIDAGLWEKMEALTLPDLQANLGNWMGRREIEAILRRRDRMKTQIDQMVKERGAPAVFIK